MIWQLGLGVTLAVLAPGLAQLLTGSPDIQAELTVLIRFLLPSYTALGVCMLVVSAGNALGLPLRAMLMSAVRLFVCYLPCLWLGTMWAGLAGLAAGAAIGNVLAGLLAWQLMRLVLASRTSSGTVNPHKKANLSR